ITQIAVAVVATEKDDLMSATVIGHLGIGAWERGDGRIDLGPGSPVKRPGIVQVTAAAESTEKDHFFDRSVIGHGGIGAGGWRDRWGKLSPGERCRVGLCGGGGREDGKEGEQK